MRAPDRRPRRTKAPLSGPSPPHRSSLPVRWRRRNSTAAAATPTGRARRRIERTSPRSSRRRCELRRTLVFTIAAASASHSGIRALRIQRGQLGNRRRESPVRRARRRARSSERLSLRRPQGRRTAAACAACRRACRRCTRTVLSARPSRCAMSACFHPSNVVHHEHLSLRVRQRLDRGLKPHIELGSLRHLERRRLVRVRRFLFEHIHRSHTPSPLQVERAIANDGQQPRAKLLGRRARVEMLQRRQEPVLHRVIRVGLLAQHGEARRREPRECGV